jgi:hypothetical protein
MADQANPVEEVDTSVDTSETESFDDSGDDWDDPSDEGFDSQEDEPEESETVEESEDTESDDDTEESEQSETKETKDEDTASDDVQEEVDSSDTKTREDLAHESFKRREAERKLREAEQKREEENLQRYLDEAEDDQDLLRERLLEVKEHNLTKQRSEVLEKSLEVDMKQAVIDLGLKSMDDATKNFVARRLDEFETTRVIRDKNGRLLDVRGDVYQYLKEELDSISEFKGIGAREQTKKKTVEKAMTIPKASRTPKEPSKDTDIDDFDKAFYG